MKLTDVQKEVFKNYWGDWEAVHGEYDKMMKLRLIALDQEFVKDLNDATKGATFWFA